MVMKVWIKALAALGLAAMIAVGGPATAGEADVVDVQVIRMSAANGIVTYRFDVTIAHEDVSFDHYADAWEIVGPGDQVLGVRELLHPHVDEQPFTRSLVVQLPESLTVVTVRAHDSVHGYGGRTMGVTLPR